MDQAAKLAEAYDAKQGGVRQCHVCNVSEFETDYELWHSEDDNTWTCEYCLKEEEQDE